MYLVRCSSIPRRVAVVKSTTTRATNVRCSVLVRNQKSSLHSTPAPQGLWDKAMEKLKGPKRLTDEELDKMEANNIYQLGAAYFTGVKGLFFSPNLQFSILCRTDTNSEMSIPIDPQYAVRLWKKSRDKGSPFAAYSLAMMKLGDNPSSFFVEDDTVDPLDTILQLAENGFTQALVWPLLPFSSPLGPFCLNLSSLSNF